ncbi:MAG: zinc-dependent alcohol dehydrogenase, partial [Gaiellaceae bacterium]
CGGVGCAAVAGAALAGARMAVAVDIDPRKLEQAKRFGATHTVNSSEVDPVDAIRELTGGNGADVVVEAVGTEQAWQDALALVRPGGTVVFFGGRELAVDTFRLHYEELTLRGAFHHTPRHVRAALAFLASGAYPWERLVTHRVGLEQVASLFADPPAGLLKAAVLP